MRMLCFARRNLKEILRDKLNLAFGLGFPLGLLFLMSAIQSRIPVDLFRIDTLTPGIAVFGLSFISLFSAILLAKDRSSALMARLSASPLTAGDFILGYTLPMLPVAGAQALVCYGAAAALGLPLSWNVLGAWAVACAMSVFFIGVGLLCGALLSDKQVGGLCGALLTNLSAWLSGAWFDLKLVGGPFEKIANLLPFVHAVNAGRSALSGGNVFPEMWYVIGYGAAFLALASAVFLRRRARGSLISP